MDDNDKDVLNALLGDFDSGNDGLFTSCNPVELGHVEKMLMKEDVYDFAHTDVPLVLGMSSIGESTNAKRRKVSHDARTDLPEEETFLPTEFSW